MLMAMFLTACQDDTVYSCYVHTSLSGWEKNDTLTFQIPAMKQTGTYTEEVGIRINSLYPFTGLRLVVDQLITPSNETRSDTLDFELIDEQGYALGQGVSCKQYTCRLTNLSLNEGDSLYIAIRHDMKREIMPGINDVGFKVTRR